ncbi:TPA: hypothetical protein N0F65_004175 [Lagenidium giganteum]|uniref:[phosphatase 2A protein]-leucine-carboxy methyltransferase n=1 Tax=Lagenidium giganteum TaxID=4803 RepID=A0AAV2YPL9_9STRA|nr:TPA: hypothetical protein N0F65_004175 [Lagenidium giganteum]
MTQGHPSVPEWRHLAHAHEARRWRRTTMAMATAMESANDLNAEDECSVLRYYTTQMMLRYVFTDDYDPDGASFPEFGSTEGAPYLALYEPTASQSSSLLMKSPTIVVVPPVQSSHSETRLSSGIFTVIPAEGFAKEPGQPVYYNDPIELVDQKGRVLGIASRSPHTGHLAADGHSGALVIVFERRKSRVKPLQQRMFRGYVDTEQLSLQQKLGLRRDSTRSSLVEICGGDRVFIPGLIRARKKPFTGGCIMQQRYFSDQRESAVLSAPELTCEIVLKAGGAVMPTPERVPTSSRRESSSNKSVQLDTGDRTATGEFVGVLHSGLLYRRTDQLKIWKKRFFVLTQVALHRFEANMTLSTLKKSKSRGDVLLRDVRCVRYEKFARPHELDIELHNGKKFSFHCLEAVACAKWASVISHAIENPSWVHTERSCLTVWRSDDRFESPNCPQVDRITLSRYSARWCGRPVKPTIVVRKPRWNEKLSVGEMKAESEIIVYLTNGNAFRLSLEEFTRAQLNPSWMSASTTTDVDLIMQSMDGENLVSEAVKEEVRKNKEQVAEAAKSMFLVRLKFKSDLQLDRRLKTTRSYLQVSLGVFGLVISSIVAVSFVRLLRVKVPWWLAGVDATVQELAGPTHPSVLPFMLLSMTSVAVALAPFIWQAYSMRYRSSTMEAKLHWFITLIALEVRPKPNDPVLSPPIAKKNGDGSDEEGKRDSDETKDGQVKCVQPPQPAVEEQTKAIARFRLENGLDAILGRPNFSFFAIKKHFPHAFLQRDAKGRRVLKISLNAVNWKGLASQNISQINVRRHFLFLWEFIWSYHDLKQGVTHSELAIIVDCSGWGYVRLFSTRLRIIYSLIELTYLHYPRRLTSVVFVADTAWVQLFARALCACFPADLRAKCEITSHWQPTTLPSSPRSPPSSPRKRPTDETALYDFVTSLLSTYANVSIPNFTKREMDQATSFTKCGRLRNPEEDTSQRSSLAPDKPKSLMRVGTKALLVPGGTMDWRTVYEAPGVKMVMNCPASASTKDRTKHVIQWRGEIQFKSSSPELLLRHLQDPQLRRLWNPNEEQVVLLDSLSRREDLCFWSRNIPYMSFSRDSQDSTLQSDAVFNCVVRRICEERKKRITGLPSYTVIWKTTTSQRVILQPMDQKGDRAATSSTPVAAQWRDLEDPYATICFVIEPNEPPTTRNSSSGDEKTSHGTTFYFWFQTLAPRADDSRMQQLATHKMASPSPDPRGDGGAHDHAVMETASDASLCKLSASALGYYADPFVQFFVKAPSRRMPLINRGYYARVAAIETIVLRFLQQSDAKKQVVVLGAGLDTMYFRLRQREALANCEYFELDFGEVTTQKILTMKRRKALTSVLELNTAQEFLASVTSGCSELHVPGYHLLACDLRDTEATQKKLEAAGIDKTLPTLFISECVLIYMEACYSKQLLAWSAEYFDDVGYALYEQILPDDAFGRMMMENIKARGCDLLSIRDYPTIEAQMERFREHHFGLAQCWDMNDVYYKFLDPHDRQQKEKLEIFDELEEFHMLQAHYCVVVASKQENSAVATSIRLRPFSA